MFIKYFAKAKHSSVSVKYPNCVSSTRCDILFGYDFLDNIPGWVPKYISDIHEKEDDIVINMTNTAYVNTPTSGSDTPLHIATKSNAGDYTVKLLLDHGADVNVVDDTGRTPLHYAVMFTNLTVVEHLLDHGADVNKLDNNGKSPVSHALDGGNIGSLPLLAERGAEMSILAQETGILKQAIYNGNKTIAGLILKNGGEKTYALHYAVEIANLEMVKLCLKLGADVTALNDKGENALHLSVRNGYSSMAELFLNHKQ